jgi:chlorobactene glucosyltransferase
MLLVCSFLWPVVVVLLLARAARYHSNWPPLAPDRSWPSETAPRVTVVVPARNEEGNVTRCLTGLLRQDYPADRFEVVVVDDNSMDRTAEIVCGFVSFDERVCLIPVGDLPPSWSGKSHACWQGAFAAEGEWLCFLDADVSAAPGLLRAAVSRAETSDIDLLSLEPFQELGTFGERLIIPAARLLFAFTCSSAQIGEPPAGEAVANGQFILVRRAAYVHVGGHAAVHGEIREGVALARLVESSGGRVLMLGAEHLARVEMYRGLTPLWEGLSRNAIAVAGGVWTGLFLSLEGLLLGWVAVALPLATLLTVLQRPSIWAGLWALAFSVLGSLVILAAQIGSALHFRIPFWYGLLFPLGCSLAAVIGLRGLWERMRGRIPWKGRVYALPAHKITCAGGAWFVGFIAFGCTHSSIG